MESLLILHCFAGELAESYLGDGERLPSQRCGPIKGSYCAAVALLPGSQISPLFHRVEHGVEGTGTEFVSMPRQLVDHPLTINLVLCGVVQHVEADESANQVLELHRDQPLSTTESKGSPSSGLSSAAATTEAVASG